MKQKTILVATAPDDLHAIMVRRSCTEIGHKVELWLPGEVPENSSASWRFGKDIDQLRLGQTTGSIAVDDMDVFWFRRLAGINIKQQMHPADHAMAISESRSFVRGVLEISSARATAVNDVSHAMRAEIKPYQLSLAKQVGLRIPETLISNDPDDIRKFIASGTFNSVVYKAFRTAIWESEKGAAFGYTAVVTENDLPSAATLRLTPGIFQEKLEKSYEVRVTCMGGRLIAVRLDSQSVGGAEVDWRSAQGNSNFRCKEVPLPSEIESKCRNLLRCMNLRFGCIDFVVTPDDTWYFLEINQMGQFLWIEAMNPSIPMLDYFLGFLLAAESDDVNDYVSFGVSYYEFYDDSKREIDDLIAARGEVPASDFVYKE